MNPSPSSDYIRAYMPERGVDVARTALLIIDMQYATGSRQGALSRTLQAQGSTVGDYRFDRIERQVLPHTRQLRDRCTALARPVLHVTVGAALPDATDAPVHMRKLFVEFSNHVGSREHEILDELKPRAGEHVLRKTTIGAFASTNIDSLLRALGCEQLYLCGISAVIASLIGIPIGIYSATRDRVWAWVQLAIDTLQTLPSFVYLMPAVMLFRVGDFTAMIAVVAFAVAPAIRYTALGIRKVDPKLIEAGRAMGCTEWQILTRIRLKLALPEILLGLNQTIMFALSMLVITALVGTRDLGQEVYIALTKADTGRGLVAGLSIAAIAIIADRLISAGAVHARRRLGLE